MDRTVDLMPLRAGNLGRVSKKDQKKKDPRDRARSIAEQHEENSAAIDANGHLEATRYQDEQSASRFAKKEREDWARLLADVESGNLDIVYLWETSRGSRRLSEWIDFIDLCREHGVLIHVTTHRTTYDASIRRQRKSLVEDGVDNEDESEKTSERVKRHLRTNKEHGMPHGVCKYGYRRVYAANRALLGQEPDDNAPLCAEIITRAAAGEPVSVIAADLNARGIPGPGGGTWYRRQIFRIATSVAYIGKIRVDGELIDARWPGIVPEDVFWAAQHLLTSPARKMTRPGRSKYLLSYLMTCGKCGSALAADTPRKRMVTAKYRCSSDQHCASVVMEDADAFVMLAVRKKLSDPGVYKHLVNGSDERVVRARAEAARLRAELDEWASADISAHAYGIREAKILPLIEAAEKRAEELTVPIPLRDLATPGTDIQARWDAMPVAARRDVVRLLFPDLRLLPGKAPAYQRISHGPAGLPEPVPAQA
jgi:site-specific DNA recombinase